MSAPPLESRTDATDQEQPSVVRLSRGVLENVAADAYQSIPYECCGVLLGNDHTITRAFPIQNRRFDGETYCADSVELACIQTAAGRAGLTIVGFYHSHVNAPPHPSSADCHAEAHPHYPAPYHLILTPGQGWVLYDAHGADWHPAPAELID